MCNVAHYRCNVILLLLLYKVIKLSPILFSMLSYHVKKRDWQIQVSSIDPVGGFSLRGS